jgi:homoserine O-acetyltransferase/O-succinyltransferase
MLGPKARLTVIILCCIIAGKLRADDALNIKEGDFIIHDFHFRSGEVLASLRLHYRTLGQPVRDALGYTTNAVLMLHATAAAGGQFLQPRFGRALFEQEGLLDPDKYFVILPDSIGHGQSSKPSDGLHALFPTYDYEDMVAAQYALVTQGLGINHLRLILGTSMGCMHSFIWAESHFDFMDAVMPLACLPVPIAGRNRIWRKMIMDAIRSDPDWAGGEYKTEPQQWRRTAAGLWIIAGGAPREMQEAYPTPDSADAYLERTTSRFAGFDANDLLYQLNASRNYDASHGLDKIVAQVMWVNWADDFINPPELGIAEQQVKKLRNGRFVLVPINDRTHGHSTYGWPALWDEYLHELLASSGH